MEQMKLQGTLEGHNGWVTQIATTTRDDRTTVISSSRDKTMIIWDVDSSSVNETGHAGRPLKSLHGHGHFVSDVVISQDGQFALSGSWDKSLRLWDLNTGASTRRFASHEKDVLSVAFSADNRQIVSGSRDRTIKLWNTLAQCKFTIQEDCHTDWVSTVRFSPNVRDPVIVSAGWDKVLRKTIFDNDIDIETPAQAKVKRLNKIGKQARVLEASNCVYFQIKMNYNLFDFNGTVKRNRNQDAMLKTLTSRDDFMRKLEAERRARQEDHQREGSVRRIQRFWRRYKAVKITSRKAREAFDRCTNEGSPENLSHKISLLNLCYKSAEDNERLLTLCGQMLNLIRAKKLDELPSRNRRQLGTLILKFLQKAGPDSNLAAPLRVFGELLDSDEMMKLVLKEKYIDSMLRLIVFFTPSTSGIHVEETLPARLETLCDYLIMPIFKIPQEKSKMLASLLTTLCKSDSLLSVITVVLPFLRRMIAKGKCTIQELIQSNVHITVETKNEREILSYAFVFLLQGFSIDDLSFASRHDYLKLIVERLEFEKPSTRNKETPMDTDLISDEQILLFTHSSTRKILSGPWWVKLCVEEGEKGDVDDINVVARLTEVASSPETLHLLAGKREFLQRLWIFLESNGVQEKLKYQKHMDTLKNGMRLDVAAQTTYLPCLSLFSQLLAIFVRNTEDEFFVEGNTKMPFSRDAFIKVARSLRDVVLGLTDLAFPDDLQMREHEKTIEGKQEAQRWSTIYENMVNLIRILQQKDQRVHFLPEGLWNDHNRQVVIQRTSMVAVGPRRRGARRQNLPAQPTFDFVRHLFANQPGGSSFDDDDDSEDETSKPILSATDLRNLSIMRSIPFVVPFRQRIKIFDEMLLKDKEEHGAGFDNWGNPAGHSISISVRRQHLYEDSFDALSIKNVPDLRLPMRIHMINWVGLDEAGIDGGGIFREYLSELARTAFDPEKGFFQYTADRLLYPNPMASKLYDNYSQHFYFLGRIIAKLIYEKQLAEIRFADFFLAQLLGAERAKNVDLHHMKSYDPVIWRQLMQLREYSEEGMRELELDFTILQEELGAVSRSELIPGGASVRVTTENRDQYVQLYCNYSLYKRMEPIVDSMRAGVTNVLDVQLLAIFSSSELQFIVSGADVDIDVNDMRRYSVIHNLNNDRDKEYMDLFWATVSSMPSEDKRALLKFITGCSRPPLDGFKELYPQIGIQLTKSDGLPTSATCMNLLKLPVYKNLKELGEKLKYAIHAGAGFELS
ncbi:unnamed protein product, partial [Mesorhabditis belari]|uniref:HECT-type E3 ubiquitin transferase n=1 Tax=Mesorhabditis belari TaxID=2138241 RepID=A0AAF3EW09_9BILA